MYKRPTRGIKFAILVSLLSGALLQINIAQAGQKDFDLPMKIISNFQTVDGKRKTSIFKEDVRITQGSLSIDADEVEVMASLGEGKEIFIARGNPASYTQTMDDGKTITAKAAEIKYSVESRTLDLTGDAELIQDSSMVQGGSITFNLEKEQLIAGGDGKNNRVTTVFQTDVIKNKN